MGCGNVSLEPAGTWAHHRRFRGPGGVTALGIVTTPRAERSTQQRSTQQSRALDVGERQNKKCCGVEVQYTLALQDLHCRTCTPHTLLCDTTHCITTLHYTTVHTAVHSPHTTPPHGESDLPVGRGTVTDTTAQTQLQTHHCTHHCGYLVGGPKPACGPYTLTHRDMHVQR